MCHRVYRIILRTFELDYKLVFQCSQGSKGVLVKAVGDMEASTAFVFEEILSLDRHQRYEYAHAGQSIFEFDGYAR